MQDPNIRHLGTIAQLCRAIFVSDIAVFVLKSDGKLQPTNLLGYSFATKARIDNRKNKTC